MRDQGVGIEEDEAHRLPGRFTRGATGRGVEGSGLGLTIVDAIATAHGGRVEITSTVGVGSRFTIVLPLTDTACPAHPNGPTSTDTPTEPGDLDDLDALMGAGADRR